MFIKVFQRKSHILMHVTPTNSSHILYMMMHSEIIILPPIILHDHLIGVKELQKCITCLTLEWYIPRGQYFLEGNTYMKYKECFASYLNIICVSRTIHMSIVTLSSLILHMSLHKQVPSSKKTKAKKKHSLEDKNKKIKTQTVAIVIPLFFSSGALSISSKAIAFAFPSSART